MRRDTNTDRPWFERYESALAFGGAAVIGLSTTGLLLASGKVGVVQAIGLGVLLEIFTSVAVILWLVATGDEQHNSDV
jgi:hypothetical protein